MSRKKFESKKIEISLNIPSGEIVYAAGFGDEFELPEAERPETLNEIMGLKQMTEAYGRHQIFHGYVGNSCPSLYKQGDKITIASKSYTRQKASKVEGRKIGTIITDLWWYSLMDRQEYLKRGGDSKTPFFKVKPGQYLLKHNLSAGYFDGETEIIYATLELSSEIPKEWKLPEEEMLPVLRAELKKQLKGKNSLYLYPKFSPISGKLIAYKAEMYTKKTHGNLMFSEDQCKKDSKQIIKFLIAAAEDQSRYLSVLKALGSSDEEKKKKASSELTEMAKRKKEREKLFGKFKDD